MRGNRANRRARGRGRGRGGRGRGRSKKSLKALESDDEEMPMPSGEEIIDEPEDPAGDKQTQEQQHLDMEADISLLEAPTFTTINRGPPEPMLRLNWDHRVNLVGEKVLNPMIHCCDQCNKPILIYGRMIPCKHVFCLKCAKREEKICPRCNDKVHRVEQVGLGTVFMCVHGGTRYGVVGCRRTYLSQRDLLAHINHRHTVQSDMSNSQFNSHMKETSAIEKMLTGPSPGSHSSHHPVSHPSSHSISHPPSHPVPHPSSHVVPHSSHPSSHSSHPPHPSSHSLSHPVSHSLPPLSSHPVPHQAAHPMSHPSSHSLAHPPSHSVPHPISLSSSHSLSSVPPQSRGKNDPRSQEVNHHRNRGGQSPPPPPPPPYAPMQHRPSMMVAPPGYPPAPPPPTQNSMRTNLITVPIQDVEMPATTYHHHYTQPPPSQYTHTHSAYAVPPHQTHQPPPQYYPPVSYNAGGQPQYVPSGPVSQAVPPPQGVPPGMSVRPPQYHDNQYRPPPQVNHGQPWQIPSNNPPPTFYR